VSRNVAISQPCVGEEEWQALREPLESGWLTQGPKVSEFEAAFAQRHSIAHALAVTSCTTGLHIVLAALGIGPGDEVVVPAFTWVATANVVLYVGATPVFADVDPRTYNLDPRDLADRLSERTRAVIPVHLFGLCADMDAIRSILPEGVLVLEDAACAAGATYHGRSAGTLGDAGVFSFHPRKSITTGEGGMITTADQQLAARAEVMRNHGASVPEEVRHAGPAPYLMPDFDELGFNYRMTDLQAAVGIVQLTKLDAFIAERDRWAGWYNERLADLPWLSPPLVPDGSGHAWQAYVTCVEEGAPYERNEIMRRLQEAGIATRPGTHAVSELSFYRRRLGLEPGRFATASDLQERTMALPLHNRMSEADYEHVAEQLHRL
jgi:dTDP-4-amino-4,6-dideoxygalactose transaminase